MAGLLAANSPAYTLPFTGNEVIALDTKNPGGAAPQSAGVTTGQIALIGRGSVLAVPDAAVIAVDATQTAQFSVTLGAVGRTLTISKASPGEELIGYITQDATGSRTITTYTNVLWASGTLPVLTVTAGATDVLRFTYNATLSKFIGEVVAKAVA